MNNSKISDTLIEDKKQEILGFLKENYPVSFVSGTANQYQTKYVILDKYKTRNESINWKDDPRVWINIHSTNKKDGSIGLLIQIKCDCEPWKGGRNGDDKKFAEKYGFPVNNKNINYTMWRGKILDLNILNEGILTFNPSHSSQVYFKSFLKESFKVYGTNHLEYEMNTLNGNTPKLVNSESNLHENHLPLGLLPLPITEYNEDIYVQSEIGDSLYQTEVQESFGWEDEVIVNDVPELKPLKASMGASEFYRRNTQKGKNAVVIANHFCEIDVTHKDFTSKLTGNNYVEAHHLIPMEYQDRFDVSIDVEANIISLCVTCHKKLHHAVYAEKEAVLKQLYKKRKDRIGNCEIVITEDTLLSFYK